MIAVEGIRIMDGMRAYLRALRIRSGLTQEEAATTIGLSLRAYTDWEMGRTEEIKAGPLMKLVTAIGARLDDIKALVTSGADAAAGEALAQRAVTEQADPALARIRELAASATPEERERMLRVLEALRTQ